MNELNTHYSQLLGLGEAWVVHQVNLDLTGSRVEIRLQHAGKKLYCAQCQGECSQADTAPVRRWRHLDTMQFETIIEASVPRSKCTQCGVKTVAVPWAGKHSRFTSMFEAFAIKVLQAASNVNRAAELLKLSWNAAHTIMERAVERGMERRGEESIEYVGIDEKSFGKGQSYRSSNDIANNCGFLDRLISRTQLRTAYSEGRKSP